MKAIIVEIQGDFAAVLADDGRIVKVKNHNYAIGQVIEMKENEKRLTKKAAIWAVSVAAMVCIGGTSVWAYSSPYSYVSLDVNPSIEYTLNRFDRVIEVKAVNDDGEEIMESLALDHLNHKSIEDAMDLTVEKIAEEGFFGEDLEGDIIITTSGKDLKKAGKLAEKLEVSVKEDLEDENVQVTALSVGRERVEEARKLGVTPGKLLLVEKLQASADDPDEIILEDWLDKPVKDIMKATKENKENSKYNGAKDDQEKNEQDISQPDASKNENKTQKINEKADAKEVKSESKEEAKEEKAAVKTQKSSAKEDDIQNTDTNENTNSDENSAAANNKKPEKEKIANENNINSNKTKNSTVDEADDQNETSIDKHSSKDKKEDQKMEDRELKESEKSGKKAD